MSKLTIISDREMIKLLYTGGADEGQQWNKDADGFRGSYINQFAVTGFFKTCHRFIN